MNTGVYFLIGFYDILNHLKNMIPIFTVYCGREQSITFARLNKSQKRKYLCTLSLTKNKSNESIITIKNSVILCILISTFMLKDFYIEYYNEIVQLLRII